MSNKKMIPNEEAASRVYAYFQEDLEALYQLNICSKRERKDA
jgi:hypothetical protein